MENTTDQNPKTRAAEALRRVHRSYSAGSDRPLGGYLKAMAGFSAYAAGCAVAVRLRGRPLPERPEPYDVLLTSVATFRLSRLLTKSAVTSPLRAPFTRYEGPEGPSELSEEVRGDTPSHAVGELLTCPFCLGTWVATGLTAAQLVWPRGGRTVTGALTALAVSDLLQLGYAALTQKVEED
ncbi:DUF1360 domain-containing protein [Streptomyces sp. 549]|uniref:DUF1360 domain-containing protein n=1 Tax=Streptomyces sp. 549 TaxID=3049076 RepID=UPI0024C2B781|nr:DUF1360 domain-containing protein [Streptomyces sp. 549]MDK1475830.1 DUF1360 domain-containing protein [Streptomyces sp. 549]